MIFFALFTTLFFIIYNYTISIMASLYIVGDLGASHSIAIYSVTFYALGNALGVPLGQPLARRFGTGTIFVYSLLFFALFSFFCATVTSYALFVAMRFAQGFVAAPLYVLINKLIGLLQPDKRKETFSIITVTIFAVSPVIGACIGGFVSYDYKWRYLFYLNIPFVVGLACYFGWRLKNFDIFLKEHSFDGWGYCLYVVGVFLLSFWLMTGQQFDWFRSPLLNVCLPVGLVCFSFFILWELYHENPILDLRLFKNPVFSFALFNLAALFSAYFGMIILLAYWLNLYVNYTPIWIALLLGTMAISGIFPAFLMKKSWGLIVDCRIPLAIAALFFAISCFHTMLFNVEINFGRIAFSRTLAGFGLALFLPPLIRLGFRSVPPEKNLEVVALFQSVRALSSGLGAVLYVTLWNRWQVFYAQRLGDKLTVFSSQTDAYFKKAETVHLTGEKALAQLEVYVQRQATTLALDDIFYLMGSMMVGLLFIMGFTLFFKKAPFNPK